MDIWVGNFGDYVIPKRLLKGRYWDKRTKEYKALLAWAVEQERNQASK